MSFVNPVAGFIPNSEFVYSTTTVNADDVNCTNLTATNANITNLVTTTFNPVNINGTNLSVVTASIGTANIGTEVTNIAYINILNAVNADINNANINEISTGDIDLDTIILKEQSATLSDKSLIYRDANEIIFAGRQDSFTSSGTDFLFYTGLKAGTPKLRISRSNNIVDVIDLDVANILNAPTINADNITITGDTITNALITTDLDLKVLKLEDDTTAEESKILRQQDILKIIGSDTLNTPIHFYNLAGAALPVLRILNDNHILINGLMESLTIKGDLSQNLLAGTGISLSTVAGVTTINNIAQVQDPLTINTLNSTTINNIGTITTDVLIGNISGNLAAGTGISLSTTSGITTITNTAPLPDPLTIDTLNSNTINTNQLNAVNASVSGLLIAPNIEGFTKSTEYGFKAQSDFGVVTVTDASPVPFNVRNNTTGIPNAFDAYCVPDVLSYDKINYRYTIPAGGEGFWLFGWRIFINTSPTATPHLRFSINGQIGVQAGDYAANNESCTYQGYFSAGDTIRIENGASGNISLDLNPERSYWWGHKLIPANNLITTTTDLQVKNIITTDDITCNGTLTALGLCNLETISAANITSSGGIVSNAGITASDGNITGTLNTGTINNTGYITSANADIQTINTGQNGTITLNQGSGTLSFYSSTTTGEFYISPYIGNLNLGSAFGGLGGLGLTMDATTKEIQIYKALTTTSINNAGLITTENLIGDISANLAAGNNISLSTVGGVTTITGFGSGTIPDPLTINTINSTTINNSGIITSATLNGNISNNVEAGLNTNLSTTAGVTKISSVLTNWISLILSSNYSPGNGTGYNIKYDTTLSGNLSYTQNNGTVTIPTTGLYAISGSLVFDVASGTSRVNTRIRMRVNDVFIGGYAQAYGYSRFASEVSLSTATFPEWIGNLTAGDLITMRAEIAVGTNSQFDSSWTGYQIVNGSALTIKKVG